MSVMTNMVRLYLSPYKFTFKELNKCNSFAMQNRYGPQLKNMAIGCAANWIDEFRCRIFCTAQISRALALSNLLQMLCPGIPGSFGFATGLAAFPVRDEVRIINNDGLLFLKCE
jgi:hypothetical protein